MVIKACNNLTTFIEYTAAHESFSSSRGERDRSSSSASGHDPNGNLTPSMAAFMNFRATGSPRLGQTNSRVADADGQAVEKDLDVALDLAGDSA